MRSILKSSLVFSLALVLLFATACGQKPPAVSDVSVPAESDLSEQPSSSADVSDESTTTEVTTTTAETTTATTEDTTAKVTTTTASTTTTAAITVPTTATTTVTTTTTTVTTTVTTTTTTKQTTTTTRPTDAPDAHPGEEWTLIWSDEFNGTELDTDTWYVENGEKGSTKLMKENVAVVDGNCVLTVKREQVGEYEITGASLHTWRNFNFQYGRLEFRAKLPYGQGVFPALWTMGDSYWTASDTDAWPACGEIDVMELIGSGAEEEKYDLNPNKKVSGTLHWGTDRDHHRRDGKDYLINSAFPADYYHVYAIEWDEEAIVWYVDDVAYHRVTLDKPNMGDSFHQPHWIIMNIVMNGLGAVSPLPQSMYVDYVRVYQKK